MVKASPQLHTRNPGEIVVLPRVAAHGVADLPAPRIEDFCLADLGVAGRGDLGNVVPFRRLKVTQADAPACVVSLAARPAPLPPRLSSRRFWLAVAVTLAAHAVALGAFFHEPPPLPSLGIEVMSVEIVVGTNSPAGNIDPTSNSEVTTPPATEEKIAEEIMQPPPASDETKEATQLQEPVQEPAKDEPMLAAVEPEIVPEPKVEQQPEPQPQQIVEQAPEKAVEPEKPIEKPLEKPVVAAIAPATPTKPVEAKPVETKREPVKPPVATRRPEPQKKQDVKAATKTNNKPTQTPKNDRIAAAPAVTPQVEARGVAVGRSSNNADYYSRVLGHLLRFRTAYSGSGVSLVQFTLSGSGAVTSVRLASASGDAKLDETALSMVRRASPFPAPPDGRNQWFSVPIKPGG